MTGRLLVAVVVLALVAAPAAVFALVKASEPATAPQVHHARSVSAPGPVDSLTFENVSAEKKALTRDVVRWKAHHPGGSCTLQPPSSAQCTTADGLPADLQVVAVTSTAP